MDRREPATLWRHVCNVPESETGTLETCRHRIVGPLVSAVCRWLILAALTGQLVFAHGCHGDEDHELFGAIDRLVK